MKTTKEAEYENTEVSVKKNHGPSSASSLRRISVPNLQNTTKKATGVLLTVLDYWWDPTRGWNGGVLHNRRNHRFL